MMRVPAGWLVLVAVGATWGCRSEAEPAPTAPDVTQLIADWSTQTGSLSAAAGASLVEGFTSDLEALTREQALLEAMGSVIDALGSEDEDETEATQAGLGVKRQALDASAGGWARITYICPGTDLEVVDPDKGHLELQLVYADGGIRDQLVWGDAVDCQLGEVVFDGALSLWLGTGGLPMVVDFAGTLGGEALSFDLGFAGGGVFLRRGLEDDGGTFLVGLVNTEPTEEVPDPPNYRIYDAAGPWECRIDTDDGSGACDRGGTGVTW